MVEVVWKSMIKIRKKEILDIPDIVFAEEGAFCII